MKVPPHAWTTEALWLAYAQLEKGRVRGVGAQRILTDLVSLVRHAVFLEDELMPYPERVQQREHGNRQSFEHRVECFHEHLLFGRRKDNRID